MVEVNRQLRDYLPLHEIFDAWLVIAVEDDEDNGDNTIKGKQEKTLVSPSSLSSSSLSSSSVERLATQAAGIDAVYRWRLQVDTSANIHSHTTHTHSHTHTHTHTHTHNTYSHTHANTHMYANIPIHTPSKSNTPHNAPSHTLFTMPMNFPFCSIICRQKQL